MPCGNAACQITKRRNKSKGKRLERELRVNHRNERKRKACALVALRAYANNSIMG
jgi:hypothetical protein